MLKNAIVFICGALIGGLLVWKLPAMGQASAKDQAKTETPKVDLVALNNDVAKLKDIVPSNSHLMADVGFHYNNLWFAGQKKNWPLATFYYDETRSHIRWLIRKSPTVKTREGEIVDIKSIFEAIDTSSMAMLKKSIEDKNPEEFTSNYKLMLEACYSCHKSVGRPYLRPMVPTTQPQSIINYAPDVSWPS
jgi:hypothetical protein